jgi:N-acetylglutamate synthase-like GNAT family acetyltransferase
VSPNIIVRPTGKLPDDLDRELAPAAAKEGFKPINVLRRDWDSGRNRFNKTGEAFYTARIDGRLIGVCGLNQDPYAANALMGRLRRLYVLPRCRRMGVGRSLVGYALAGARNHFPIVRLRTLDEESARFFEAIGFQKIEGLEAVTHQITFDGQHTSL